MPLHELYCSFLVSLDGFGLIGFMIYVMHD